MKAYLIMLAVVGTMGAGGYLYYKDTQAKLAVLQENNAKLEAAVAESERTVSELKVWNQQIQAVYEQVNEDYQAVRKQNQLLADKLGRHDIGVLAERKPGLVENIVNNATENVNRCFELLSGAELTEKERSATNANAFNSECPWLWVGSTNP